MILLGTGSEKLELRYDRGNGHGTYYQAFEGLLPNVTRRYRETQSDYAKKEYEEYMATRPCPRCHGQRLSDVSRAVTVGGKGIWDFCCLQCGRGPWTSSTGSGSPAATPSSPPGFSRRSAPGWASSRAWACPT